MTSLKDDLIEHQEREGYKQRWPRLSQYVPG
jgi:hypothetical protein